MMRAEILPFSFILTNQGGGLFFKLGSQRMIAGIAEPSLRSEIFEDRLLEAEVEFILPLKGEFEEAIISYRKTAVHLQNLGRHLGRVICTDTEDLPEVSFCVQITHLQLDLLLARKVRVFEPINHLVAVIPDRELGVIAGSCPVHARKEFLTRNNYV